MKPDGMQVCDVFDYLLTAIAQVALYARFRPCVAYLGECGTARDCSATEGPKGQSLAEVRPLCRCYRA